jgi:hypothetical protein
MYQGDVLRVSQNATPAAVDASTKGDPTDPLSDLNFDQISLFCNGRPPRALYTAEYICLNAVDVQE